MQGVETNTNEVTLQGESVLYKARHGIFSFINHPILIGQSVVATTDRLIISDVLKLSPKDESVPYYKITSVKAKNGLFYSTILLNLKGNFQESGDRVKVKLWDKHDAISIYGIVSNKISQGESYSPYEIPSDGFTKVLNNGSTSNKASDEASLIAAGSALLSGLKSMGKKRARKTHERGAFDVTRPDAAPEERRTPFYSNSAIMQSYAPQPPDNLPEVHGIGYPEAEYSYIEDMQKEQNRIGLKEGIASQIQLEKPRRLDPDSHMKIFAVRRIREKHLPRIPTPAYVKHMERMLALSEEKIVPAAALVKDLSLLGVGYAAKAFIYIAKASGSAIGHIRDSGILASAIEEAHYEWNEYISPAIGYTRAKVAGNGPVSKVASVLSGAFYSVKKLILNIADRE